MKYGRKRLVYVVVAFGLLFVAQSLTASTYRVYFNDKYGRSVGVIDPETNKIVQTIEGIKNPHQVMFSPDGNRLYVGSETEKVLAVVERVSGKIIKKVPLTGSPNTIAVPKDGGHFFVAIRSAPGAIDVIDPVTLERVNSIPMKGGIHDIYLTPDGKYLIAGCNDGKHDSLTVIDVSKEKSIWDIKFDTGVLTMAVDTNPDGSTSRIFVMRYSLYGFAIVDFAQRKVIDEIKLPETDRTNAGRDREPDHPCHGIAIAPNGKTLWVDSQWDDAAFVYSLPDLKLMGHVVTGARPNWITFSPDSKKAYHANSSDNTISVIDVDKIKEVARIPIGEKPKSGAKVVLHLNTLPVP